MDTYNLADFAKASYQRSPVKGFLVDTELSGPDRTVYHDKKTAIVAFKGTTPTSGRDISVDAALWGGFQSQTNRFRKSLDVTKKAMEKYGKENVTVTGHSLGGSQAIYVHHKTGIKGSAYSPYIDLTEYRRHGELGDNFHIHMVAGDPVSLGGTMNLYGKKNVHIYTPSSKYASILTPLLQPNPLDFMSNVHPYVTTGVKLYGAYREAKKVASLHDIDNFTTGSSYEDKVRFRDVKIYKPVSLTK